MLIECRGGVEPADVGTQACLSAACMPVMVAQYSEPVLENFSAPLSNPEMMPGPARCVADPSFCTTRSPTSSSTENKQL